MPPAETTSLPKILETVGLVIAPFATLTGLLYYFGWVRTNALFGHFGIDANLLAYTPQDYLVRSAGVAFRPCAALLVGAALALAAYRLIARLRPAMLIEVVLLGVAVTGPSLAVLFGWARSPDPLQAAAGLVAGVLLLEFAAGRWPAAPPERALRRGIVAGAVLVGLFWSFAIYAQRTGERVAESLAASPHGMSTATVLSARDLGLTGPGITVSKSAAGTAFPYRYEGLRLFVFRNGRWFLLPVGWRSNTAASAIILPDSEGIRVELRG